MKSLFLLALSFSFCDAQCPEEESRKLCLENCALELIDCLRNRSRFFEDFLSKTKFLNEKKVIAKMKNAWLNAEGTK